MHDAYLPLPVKKKILIAHVAGLKHVWNGLSHESLIFVLSSVNHRDSGASRNFVEQQEFIRLGRLE